MFSVGDAYERFMGRWSRRLAPLFVQFASVRDGDTVLDVGSGTGALAAAVASAAPTSHVVGVDRSAAYVEMARAHHQGTRVRFAVGDAQHLPFDDSSFNRALSLLILNFVPQPGDAVNEMIRVTRAGGTVAAAVWDYGKGMGMLRAFWDEAVALAPEADRADERHMPLAKCGELAQLWHTHDLRDVSDTVLTIETRFASFEDYWSPLLLGQGPAGAYVKALSPNEREQLRRNLRRRLLADGDDGTITLAARAWAVRGIVPQSA